GAGEVVQTAGELRTGQAGDLEPAGPLLLDREGQGGDGPQRAQAQPQRAQVALLSGGDAAAVGEDHGGAAHELGHDAAVAAVAVSARGQRPGQRLLPEVAAEAQREAPLVEVAADGPDGDAGLAGDGLLLRVEAQNPIEVLQRHHAGGREEAVVVGVAPADDADAFPLFGRTAHEQSHLVDAGRTFDGGPQGTEVPREARDPLRRARVRKAAAERVETGEPEPVRTRRVPAAAAWPARRSAVPVDAGPRRRVAAL